MKGHFFNTIKQYSFLFIFGTLFGIFLHILIIWLDSKFIEKPIYLDLDKNFWQSAFSFPFLPILVIEISFSLLTILFWIKMQKNIEKAHSQDLQQEKYIATVQTFQKVMSLLAEHIAINNNKILSKIEFRKNKGQSTSGEIEKASKNISEVLKILSEISFVEPYLNKKENLIQQLETKLSKLAKTES